MMNSPVGLLMSLFFVLTGSLANAQGVVANIDVRQTGTPITNYHFGQFIENLGNADVGNLVDDGLWAELLDDRKFFYPVDTITQLTPVNKRDRVRQWVPLGTPATVIMDSSGPYAGVHSPRVATNRATPTGLYQSGLSIQKKRYVGRIVLRGSPGLPVTVRLVWGTQPNERATVSIARLSSAWQTYPLTFVSGGSSGNARLDISGLGDGSFSVGSVSLMPDDNIDGFRADVIGLLKGLHSGIYRWGGNFISGYDWRDAVGNPDQRPPRYEHAWEAVESNDVGTHEMIRFAELIGVEIAFTVNAGLGDARSAGQWVEYVNGRADTPMGRLRTRNGHPAPFGVKRWCVGNESYGWWQLGHTDLKSHLIKHRQFAEKMRAVDSTIQLVASGAALEEMTVTGSARRLTGKIVADYDSASDWTGGLLRHNRNDFDYISEHFYCSVNERFDLDAGRYVAADVPLEDWTRRPANRIRAKAEQYADYARHIPGLQAKPARVYLDEWAYYTNWVHPTPTLGVTIGYARGLNEIFRHTDLIDLVGFTFGTSCLSFTDTTAAYNSTGLLYQVYQSQFGRIPVAVEGNAPQPAPKWPVGGEQPRVNAGGDTYPLDIAAALTPDRRTLTVAVVNPTETAQLLTLQLTGTTSTGAVTKWLLTGTSVEARNVVGKPAGVILRRTNEPNRPQRTIEPASIAIYRYELAKP